jgi:hypothetical protein
MTETKFFSDQQISSFLYKILGNEVCQACCKKLGIGHCIGSFLFFFTSEHFHLCNNNDVVYEELRGIHGRDRMVV